MCGVCERDTATIRKKEVWLTFFWVPHQPEISKMYRVLQKKNNKEQKKRGKYTNVLSEIKNVNCMHLLGAYKQR